MMGNAGGSGGMSLADVMGLLKNEPALQSKLAELHKRTEEAQSTHRAAVDINLKAEAARKLTQQLADEAERNFLEAKRLKEEADLKEKSLAEQEKAALQMIDDARAQLVADREAMENELRTKEQQSADVLTRREQELQGKIKEFGAAQAEEAARVDAFTAFKRDKEASLAAKDKVLNEKLAETAAVKASIDKLNAELKAKLAKIKSITSE